MKINLKKQVEYVPEWNDNKKLPAKEQISVRFNLLTTEDRNNFVVHSADKTVASIAKQVFVSSVVSIDNLEIDLDGEVVSPTPEQILNLPDMYEFFSEISSAIITESSLKDKDKKK